MYVGVQKYRYMGVAELRARHTSTSSDHAKYQHNLRSNSKHKAQKRCGTPLTNNVAAASQPSIQNIYICVSTSTSTYTDAHLGSLRRDVCRLFVDAQQLPGLAWHSHVVRQDGVAVGHRVVDLPHVVELSGIAVHDGVLGLQ